MSEENFEKALQFLFPSEGGYVNDSKDPGGPTNMGLTQGTYNTYRKNQGLPPKDVKQITKGETVDLYYKYYWKASGADSISDPNMAVALFDTAILHGVGQAQQYYKQSGGDVDKFLDIRQKHYDKRVENAPSQKRFYQGWNNRVNNLRNNIKCGTFTINANNENIEEKSFNIEERNYNNSENNYSTPFELSLEYNDYQQNKLPNLNDLMINPINEQSNNPWDMIPMAIPESLRQPSGVPTGQAANIDITQLANRLGIQLSNVQPTNQPQQQSGLFGYTNPLTGSNHIYTREEVGSMSSDEFAEHEKEIDAQTRAFNGTMPTNGDLQREAITGGGVIYVNSYTRSDGTDVRGYYRSRPSI